MTNSSRAARAGSLLHGEQLRLCLTSFGSWRITIICSNRSFSIRRRSNVNSRLPALITALFFLAPAIAKISELAPGVSVDMTELTNDWPVQLRTGELDLLISPMETVPEGFPWLPLWEGRTTGIVVRPGHPLEALYEKTGRVTESDVIRYGFVEVTWRPTTYYRLTQSRLSPLLSERNIVIKTPYFMGAAKIISESNLVMLLSDIMADWFISLGALRRIPVVSEELDHVQSKGFVTKLIWHERSHLDPAMQWMRGMISYAVKETLRGGHVVHPEEGR